MCGIIGAVSQRDISKLLLEGLRRLEYRGYDSAGIALIDSSGYLKRVRIQGKVEALANAMQETAIAGTLGIAQTRWATHGKPCELNAHHPWGFSSARRQPRPRRRSRRSDHRVG